MGLPPRGGPRGAGEPLRGTLVPVRTVRARFTCEGLGGKPEWTNVYVQSPKGNSRISAMDSQDAAFEVLLPVGTYKLWMYGNDVKDIRRDHEVPPGEGVHDLGAVEFEPTFLALHHGKELPDWTVTDARGVEKGKALLSDFRGKWVLVEFWGFW